MAHMRAAFIILHAREGYILVGSRYDGSFMIPGGYVDVGETAHRAAVREFGEETEGEGSSSFYLWFTDAPMEYIGFFVEDEKYMFFVYRTPLSFVQAVTKHTPRGRIETRESSGSTSVTIRMDPSSKKWDIVNTRTGTRAVLRGGLKTVSPLRRAHQMLTDYDSRMRRFKRARGGSAKSRHLNGEVDANWRYRNSFRKKLGRFLRHNSQ